MVPGHQGGNHNCGCTAADSEEKQAPIDPLCEENRSGAGGGGVGELEVGKGWAGGRGRVGLEAGGGGSLVSFSYHLYSPPAMPLLVDSWHTGSTEALQG